MTIEKFKQAGIEIQMMESYYSTKNIEGGFLNSLHLHLAQMESSRNSMRTKEGMKRGMIEGCWMYKPPFAYKGIRNESGKATLEIVPEKAEVIKKVFKEMATGLYSAEELRKKYYVDLDKMSKQNFLYMLRKVVYTGRIEIVDEESGKSEIVDGLHKGIIPIELFNSVQDIMDGRKPRIKKFNRQIESYPLKGIFYCADHDRTFTASASKGRNGWYNYYHCTNGKCKHRYNPDKMETLILGYLEQIKFSEDLREVFKIFLKDVGKRRMKELEQNKTNSSAKITELTKRKDKLEDDYFDGNISAENFERLSKKISEQLKELQENQGIMENDLAPIRKALEETMNHLPSVAEVFAQGSGEIKQKICGSIFSGKIEFSNQEVRTALFKPFVQKISLINRELADPKKEKAIISDGFSQMAPPLGLEPRTP
jgi:site-specific DNA recombinase